LTADAEGQDSRRERELRTTTQAKERPGTTQRTTRGQTTRRVTQAACEDQQLCEDQQAKERKAKHAAAGHEEKDPAAKQGECRTTRSRWMKRTPAFISKGTVAGDAAIGDHRAARQPGFAVVFPNVT